MVDQISNASTRDRRESLHGFSRERLRRRLRTTTIRLSVTTARRPQRIGSDRNYLRPKSSRQFHRSTLWNEFADFD